MPLLALELLERDELVAMLDEELINELDELLDLEELITLDELLGFDELELGADELTHTNPP